MAERIMVPKMIPEPTLVMVAVARISLVRVRSGP
jgi:hypothetical protein